MRARGIALTFPGSDLGSSCSLVSIRFSAKRRRTVSRETLACSVRLLDHLSAQQLQRPTGPARVRLGAGSRDQDVFFFARQLALSPRAWLFAGHGLRITEHEAALAPAPAASAP